MNSELNFEKNNYMDRENSIEYIRKVHGINFDLSNHKIPKNFMRILKSWHKKIEFLKNFKLSIMEKKPTEQRIKQ